MKEPRFSPRRFFLSGLMLGGMVLALASGGMQALAQEAAPSAEAAAPVDELQVVLQEFGKAFEIRDFTKASEVILRAEALDPNRFEVKVGRAGLFAEMGQVAKARQIYEALLAEQPESFVLHYNLCELFFLQGDYAAGRAAFVKMQEKFPENELIRFKIVLSYVAEKNLEKAVEALSAMKPGTPAQFYAMAAIALDQNEFAKAQQVMFEAERFGPGRQRLLHDSLAELNLVLRGAYPPSRP